MKRCIATVLLVAMPAWLTLAAPTWADVAGPGGKVIDCYCTDKTGARVALDEVICLQVDGRAFLARCEMSLNTPMWRDTGQTCLQSARDPVSRLKLLLPGRKTRGIDPKI